VKELLKNDKTLINSADQGNGYTPLHHAVASNRLEIVKFLLTQNPDVNRSSRYQFTPLQLAAMNGNEKVLDLLLEKKPKVDHANRGGYTALLYAIQYGHKASVEKLLKAGADVTKTASNGFAPLHMACQRSDTDMVELLLAQKKVDVNVADNQGGTPFYYACQYGNVKMAKLLLEKGGDPKRRLKNNYQPTALHCAAQTGSAELVKLLIEEKVEINPTNQNDDTPLHFAAQFGNQYYYGQGNPVPREVQEKFGGVVEALLKAGADVNLRNKQKQTPLEIAVARDNYVAVNHLLPGTKDVKEIKPVSGESVFHWCCKHGLDKALGVLLKKEKFDVGEKTAEGETPLVLACEGATDGHAGVVKLLLQRGAKVDQQLDSGETVLHVAAWNGNAKMVAAMLDAKADFSIKDKSGYTPLHLAAWNGHADAVKALLAAGAKADASVSEYTPLHAASWNGHFPVVRILLDAKADVNAKDRDGMTPLHKAAWNGHIDVVRKLLESGAEVNAKDNDGYTPIVPASCGPPAGAGLAGSHHRRHHRPGRRQDLRLHLQEPQPPGGRRRHLLHGTRTRRPGRRHDRPRRRQGDEGRNPRRRKSQRGLHRHRQERRLAGVAGILRQPADSDAGSPHRANGIVSGQAHLHHRAEKSGDLVRLQMLNTNPKALMQPLKSASVTVNIKSQDPIKNIYSPTHESRSKRKGLGRRRRVEAGRLSPQAPLRALLPDRPKEVGASLVAHRELDEEGAFMLMLSPTIGGGGQSDRRTDSPQGRRVLRRHLGFDARRTARWSRPAARSSIA
jgi:ankyrin repeat protein